MPAKRFKQPSQLRQPVRPNQYFDSLDSFHQHCLSSTSTNQRRITPRDSTRAQPTQLKDHQPTSLIVTHDFKGGYSENPYERGYSFEWLGPTDKFIYFSHHRVTVPPTQWINACHNHGTKVLGTLIFEWDKIDEIDLLLRGPSDPPRSTNYYLPLSQSDQKYTPLISTYFADRLIDLALELDLHGWLINVEVDLPKYDPIRSGSISRSLKIWLEYLRLRGELRLGPHWEVCWYDSLSHVDGRNQWLSRLDRVHNLPFFTSSSSIFLDYHWTSEHLTRSKQLLRRLSEIDQTSRSPRQRLLKLSSDYLETLSSNESLMKSLDQSVHVGVDVYGRGCPCGGGFSSWKAIEEIVQAGLSVALFAPGWTWESHHLHQAREKDVVEGAKKEEAPELLWWKAWWRDELYQWAGLFSSSVEGHVTRQESPNAYVDACRIAEDLERPRPIRGTSTSELDQQRPILEFFPARWSAPRRYFYTNWSMGSGSNGYWVESRQFSDSSKRISSWTDMSVSFPINDLSIGGCKMFCIEDDGSVVQEGLVSCQLIDRVGWSGSGSLMIDMSQETNQNESNNSLKDRYIWLNTTLVDPGPNEAIKIRLVWKPISEQGSLPLGVVLQTTRDPLFTDKPQRFTSDGVSLFVIGDNKAKKTGKVRSQTRLDSGWYESVFELLLDEPMDDRLVIFKVGISFAKIDRHGYYLGEMSVGTDKDLWSFSKFIKKFEFKVEKVLKLNGAGEVMGADEEHKSSLSLSSSDLVDRRLVYGYLEWEVIEETVESEVLMYLIYTIEETGGTDRSKGEEEKMLIGTVMRDNKFYVDGYEVLGTRKDEVRRCESGCSDDEMAKIIKTFMIRIVRVDGVVVDGERVKVLI